MFALMSALELRLHLFNALICRTPRLFPLLPGSRNTADPDASECSFDCWQIFIMACGFSFNNFFLLIVLVISFMFSAVFRF